MRPEDPFFSVCLSVAYGGNAPVLDGAMLNMRRGEILGLAGQSGSGKSTLALTTLRLLDSKSAAVSGNAWFQGRNLLALKEREMRTIRGRDIGLVLQSPLASLNPALRIETQLKEAWRAHAKGSAEECRDAIVGALGSVCLCSDSDFLRRFPAQLSVGQAQRVLIAMAILHRPALLIADEATSSLDVITQSEILDLFAELNRKLGMAILFISHDLLAAASICHRIAVLHQGEIVESGITSQIFDCPAHPYTRQLISALPQRPAQNVVVRAAGR